MMKAVLERLSSTIYIARIYDCDVPPTEPNPFAFSVVVVIHGDSAEIKALTNNVSPSGMKAGAKELAKLGVKMMWWRHDGEVHHLRIARDTPEEHPSIKELVILVIGVIGLLGYFLYLSGRM